MLYFTVWPKRAVLPKWHTETQLKTTHHTTPLACPLWIFMTLHNASSGTAPSPVTACVFIPTARGVHCLVSVCSNDSSRLGCGPVSFETSDSAHPTAQESHSRRYIFSFKLTALITRTPCSWTLRLGSLKTCCWGLRSSEMWHCC